MYGAAHNLQDAPSLSLFHGKHVDAAARLQCIGTTFLDNLPKANVELSFQVVVYRIRSMYGKLSTAPNLSVVEAGSGHHNYHP